QGGADDENEERENQVVEGESVPFGMAALLAEKPKGGIVPDFGQRAKNPREGDQQEHVGAAEGVERYEPLRAGGEVGRGIHLWSILAMVAGFGGESQFSIECFVKFPAAWRGESFAATESRPTLGEHAIAKCSKMGQAHLRAF